MECGIVRAQIYVRKKTRKRAGETSGSSSGGTLGMHQVKRNATTGSSGGMHQVEESRGAPTPASHQLKESASTSQQNEGTTNILKSDIAAHEWACEEEGNKRDIAWERKGKRAAMN